jgi:hypothetical protein
LLAVNSLRLREVSAQCYPAHLADLALCRTFQLVVDHEAITYVSPPPWLVPESTQNNMNRRPMFGHAHLRHVLKNA